MSCSRTCRSVLTSKQFTTFEYGDGLDLVPAALCSLLGTQEVHALS